MIDYPEIDPTSLRYGDVIEATFQPTVTHDLLYGTHQWIGQRFHWEAIGHASEPYKGQLLWTLWPELDDDDYYRPTVPTCDLAEIRLVEKAK